MHVVSQSIVYPPVKFISIRYWQPIIYELKRRMKKMKKSLSTSLKQALFEFDRQSNQQNFYWRGFHLNLNFSFTHA